MKDYIKLAKALGLKVYTIPRWEVIKSYHLNKENNHIYIQYMDGSVTNGPQTVITKSFLQEKQEEQFKRIKKAIDKPLKDDLNCKYFVSASLGLATILSLVVGRPAGVITGIGMAMYELSRTRKQYKLKKDLELTEWVCDNRTLINAEIKRQLNESCKTQNMEYQNLPYPEEIVNDGITLANMDQLKPKQLQKLRRIIEKKQK